MATRINPEKINWRAPTENTDGTPITEPLSYTLGIWDETSQDFIENVSFPGTLNPDGTYEHLVSELPITGTAQIALLAFYQAEPELKSDWSGSITLLLGVQPPNPPFDLAAA